MCLRQSSLYLLLTIVALPACNDSTAAPTVDYGPLLASLTDHVILPANTTAATAASALDTALVALETTPSTTTLAAAQTAWREARRAYRRLDALYFGPLSDLGIGERIDAYPADTGAIDTMVNATTPINATAIGTLGGQSKGFLGVEYLLFSTTGPSAIATQIGSAGCRSCTLARAMADEIASSIGQLADAWDPAKGAFATQVKTAGAGSTRYPRQRGALDDFVGGVGYALERVVGVDLAQPLGRKGNGTPDVTQVATRASDSAVADMTATLAGVQSLYTDEGNGFTARVKMVSARLDSEAATEAGNCASKAAAIPAPFATTLVSQTSLVQGAYDACKLWKTTWNTDLTSALGATLDPTDNDGD